MKKHLTKNVAIWFRNDLRLHDNEALYRAVEKAQSSPGSKLLPIYTFDSDLTTKPMPFGLSQLPETCGPRRSQFLIESVWNLFETKMKQRMLIGVVPLNKENSYKGLNEFMRDMAKQYGISDLFMNQEVCTFERDVESQIEKLGKELGIRVHWTWSSTLVHRDDLPYDTLPDDLPKVYSAFRKKIEKQLKEDQDTTIRECLEVEQDELEEVLMDVDEVKNDSDLLSDLGDAVQFMHKHLFPHMSLEKLQEEIQFNDRSIVKFEGGEDRALQRCHAYLNNSLAQYSFTRNDNTGDYSTKLSPWLAIGCISPRYIYHEIKNHTTDDAQKSANTLVSELLWRDFFRLLAWKMGRSFFFKKALQPKKVLEYEWRIPDNGYLDEKFQAWCNGTTGYPFVDACMRELKHTGFMHNRGRMVTASFLVKDMKIDWRLGAEYFERNLLDYDTASNYGNWAWSAGIGCDFRPRYFNPIKQGLDNDKDGLYVKRWVPELARVPKTGKLLNDRMFYHAFLSHSHSKCHS